MRAIAVVRPLAATVVAAVALLIGASPAAAQPGAPTGVTITPQRLFGVAVQSNGDVVAAGQSGGSIFVQRFGAAGGTYTGPAGVARAVAVEPNGDIVIAGTSGGAMFVQRLSPSLQPEASGSAFGGGGIANSVALGPNGEIVAAGQVGAFPSSTATVAVFNSSGGVSAQGTFGANSIAEGVAVQSDGKIVAVGKQSPGQAVDAVIARFNPNLSLDSSFGPGHTGAETYDYPNTGANSFGAVTMQNNGQILIGGQANSTNGLLALFVRFNSDGSLDGSFGSGGATAVPAGQSNAGGLIGAYGVGISGPNGNIVGGGGFGSGAVTDAAVWGLTPNGAADSGFGNNGTQKGPGSSTGPTSYEACGLAIAPDGAPDAGDIVHGR